MIRYYRRDKETYYTISDVDTVLFGDEGGIGSGWGRIPHAIVWPEIFVGEGLSPDAVPIEDYYLNATDNPYKDGFKYLETGLEAL